MANFGTNTQRVLESLRANPEYVEGEWGIVYLDNAKPNHMTANVFRACLAKLSEKGLYCPIDGYAWGKVKVEQ